MALVIGLLATFIIMQIFATSEGQKRTITGGADAQTDAAVALYLIERDLRQAGYGLSANPEDFIPPFRRHRPACRPPASWPSARPCTPTTRIGRRPSISSMPIPPSRRWSSIRPDIRRATPIPTSSWSIMAVAAA